MKRKYHQSFILLSATVCLCLLLVACSKKSTKQESLPTPWSTIIRDYQYLGGTFYDLGYSGDFAFGDSIVQISLFKSNTVISGNTQENPPPFGIAYVDPDDISASYPERYFHRRFQEIDPNDYLVQRTQFWVQFFTPLQAEDILGAFYVVRHPDAIFDTVGYLKDSCTSAEEETCMTLKLIKPDTPRPGYYTWDYEWKNVYHLGAEEIDRQGFRLDIYRGPLHAEHIQEDPNSQNSTPYLRIFGLDQLDLNGDPVPDGIVDYRQIDFSLGHLIFPNRHPFAPEPNVSFTGNPGDTLKIKVEAIYCWDDPQRPREDSRYYIYVQIDTSDSFHQSGRFCPSSGRRRSAQAQDH